MKRIFSYVGPILSRHVQAMFGRLVLRAFIQSPVAELVKSFGYSSFLKVLTTSDTRYQAKPVKQARTGLASFLDKSNSPLEQITSSRFRVGLTAISLLAALACSTVSAQSDKPAIQTVTVAHSALDGIGAEPGIMRRDPSDIIKVNDLYYVWYSKGKISPGYDATVWYATSTDGHKWTEKRMALAKGKPGTWEGASVFTPNILVAEGRYWLFYTGTSRKFKKGFNPDSKIGIAVSNSPDGPWTRLATNPALKNSEERGEFDSHLVDDACLIKRDGQY